MRKDEELTNEELLNRYFYYRTKYNDLDYLTYLTETHIKHVEKRFDEVEREVLKRMGGNK